MNNRDYILIEIQAGEGGNDSKLFSENMLGMYISYCQDKKMPYEIVESVFGKHSFKVFGSHFKPFFSLESGKHVVQRVPPTEKNGRRQTSVVTVSVISLSDFEEAPKFEEKDIQIKTKRGSGPGGQHRNKTESCVVATHIPTGLEVKIDGRSQHKNKAEAIGILKKEYQKMVSDGILSDLSKLKRSNVGNGGRTEKIRTYNFIDSRVKDHRTNRETTKIEDVVYKGKLDLILK